MLIDTHCHLSKKEYDNLDELLKNIGESDMKIIVSGYDALSNKEALSLADKYNFIYASIGFHPEVADNIEENDYNTMEEQLNHEKVVAIGEVGLDYYWNNNNKEKQQEVFERQLELAKKYNKPVIIHSRDAFVDVYRITKDSNTRGIFHCFNGSLDEANQITKINYLLGIGGIITFKNAHNIREVIKEIHIEYVVLETDSPYLTPEPFRGRKNSPLMLVHVANKLAEIKGLTYNEVCLATSGNAHRLFDI